VKPADVPTGLNDYSDQPTKTVILGAGFSRAISKEMPTTEGLGLAVLNHLGLDPQEVLDPFAGDLERWMSYLSVPQPWLQDSDNLRNRSLFEQAAQAVYEVIRLAESKVIETAPPIWLTRLIWTWCDQSADIFTFNYDSLIERCVGRLGRISTLGDIYATSVEERRAPGEGSMFSAERPSGDVLRLYKLHGSTSWGFGGLDAPSNSRITLSDRLLTWHPTVDRAEAPPPRYVPLFDDLAPLIIPPTFTKGPYYGNLALRGQWRRGANALRRTERLVVIGYSFPLGDLTTREWVSNSLNSGADIEIVDISPDAASQVDKSVGGARAIIDSSSAEAVSDYVDTNCGDYVEWSTEEVDGAKPVRVSVLVNGEERVRQDDAYRPWGASEQDARVWVDTRIEAAAPNIIDRSLTLDTSGLVRWRRAVVLPAGAKLDLSHA
jgi:hypothetical protein